MWSKRYDTETFIFGTEPAQFLVDQRSHLTPGAKALVPADGEGRNSVYLAQQGLKVTAMDNAEPALVKARKLARARDVDVNFLAADMESWEWRAGEFDLVAGIFIQFAAPALRDRMFQGIRRTLKPGGLLLLHGFTPDQLDLSSGGPKARENLYTPEMLADAFADFTILRLAEYRGALTEGQGHRGPAALIDLVARKPG